MLREGSGVVNVETITNAHDHLPDVRLSVDRTKLLSNAKPAIETFLRKLQNYKSTANFKVRSGYCSRELVTQEGSAMFEDYGRVTEKWCAVRDIVIARRSPRRLNLQPNMLETTDGA